MHFFTTFVGFGLDFIFISLYYFKYEFCSTFLDIETFIYCELSLHTALNGIVCRPFCRSYLKIIITKYFTKNQKTQVCYKHYIIHIPLNKINLKECTFVQFYFVAVLFSLFSPSLAISLSSSVVIDFLSLLYVYFFLNLLSHTIKGVFIIGYKISTNSPDPSRSDVLNLQISTFYHFIIETESWRHPNQSLHSTKRLVHIVDQIKTLLQLHWFPSRWS